MVTKTKTSQEQRAYAKELIALIGGALTAGLATSGLAIIAPEHTGPLALMGFGAIMGLGANFLDRKGSSAAVRLVLGVAAGVIMALLFNVHLLLAAAVGGLLIGAAFSLEHGTFGERAMVWLAYAGAMAAGAYTSTTLLDVGFLQGIKDVPVLAEMAQASIWSIFLMLPAGLKYVQWESDEMIAEFHAAHQGLDDKHLQALKNGEETYKRILDEIEREGQESVRSRSHGIAIEVSRGLIELTRRSQELHERVARTQLRPLELRARDLEARIRSTRDAVLKRELVAGLGEVVEQMRTRKRLEAAVARIEARQQRYLTALDRLHVTLVQNDSLSPSEGALSHSLDELSRLTDEVKYKNLSVDELVDSPFEELDEDHPEVDDAEIADLFSELRDLTNTAPGELPRARMPSPTVLPAQSEGEDTSGEQLASELFSSEDDSPEEEEERVVLSPGVDGSLGGCEDDQPEPHTSKTEVEEEVDVHHPATHSR